MAARAIYNFIEEFAPDDIFDADMRTGLERSMILCARIYFEDLYQEDFDLNSYINAGYYGIAKDKLYAMPATTEN